MRKKVEGVEEREVWQKSTAFAVSLYQQLNDCKDFDTKDQMQRAAVAIAANIAEGFDR